MIGELLLLVILSIITARLLEKRYKVASIAHSILFILMSLFFVFTCDWEPIRDMCIRWIGQNYYDSLYQALSTPALVLNLSVSAVLVFETVIFIMVPLLSIVVIINEIKEQVKEIKIGRSSFISSLFSYIKVDLFPTKEFRDTFNETYLIFAHLRN